MSAAPGPRTDKLWEKNIDGGEECTSKWLIEDQETVRGDPQHLTPPCPIPALATTLIETENSRSSPVAPHSSSGDFWGIHLRALRVFLEQRLILVIPSSIYKFINTTHS